MQRLLAFLGLIGLLGAPLGAAGQEPNYATAELRLAHAGGADCSSAEQLAGAVEQRLQRRIFAEGPLAEMRVDVGFEKLGNEWCAQIALSNQRGTHLGQRRICSKTKDCTGLDDSLALVVALMVDLTREDVQARAKPPLIPPSTAVSVPAETEGSGGWGSVVSLSGIANHGSLPGIGWGGRLDAELRPAAVWSIEVGLSGYAPRSQPDGPSETGSAEKGRFSLVGADLGLCGQLSSRERGDLRFCAGCEVGRVTATGLGYRMSRTTQSILVQPLVKMQSTWWPTADLGLRLAVGVEIPMVRDRFYATRVNGAEVTLFEPSLVAGFLQAGVSWQL